MKYDLRALRSITGDPPWIFGAKGKPPFVAEARGRSAGGNGWLMVNSQRIRIENILKNLEH